MERFPSCCLETSCYPFLLQSLTVAAHPSKNWEAMYPPLLKKADAVPEWNLSDGTAAQKQVGHT